MGNTRLFLLRLWAFSALSSSRSCFFTWDEDHAASAWPWMGVLLLVLVSTGCSRCAFLMVHQDHSTSLRARCVLFLQGPHLRRLWPASLVPFVRFLLSSGSPVGSSLGIPSRALSSFFDLPWILLRAVLLLPLPSRPTRYHERNLTRSGARFSLSQSK